MRVVVDTNVLISGLLWRGTPHQLIEQARLDVFSIIASPAALAEFEQVIGCLKFRLPRVSRDPDDDEVLALAVSARADLIVRSS